MKVHFDPEVDAISIRFDDSRVIDSEELKPGLIVDYNENGQIVAIEILGASKYLAAQNLRQMLFEVA